jgi:hypothetical protein
MLQGMRRRETQSLIRFDHQPPTPDISPLVFHLLLYL